eukprot:7751958-Alexandrium_andersonii.AAC.1
MGKNPLPQEHGVTVAEIVEARSSSLTGRGLGWRAVKHRCCAHGTREDTRRDLEHWRVLFGSSEMGHPKMNAPSSGRAEGPGSLLCSESGV